MIYDILVVGELLMDMTPKCIDGQVLFSPNPGGAPLNAAVMSRRIGSSVKFIGCVGQDIFGDELERLLIKEGIDTDESLFHENKPTSLAFVQLDEHGDRRFSFYRQGAADISLKINQIDLARFDYRSLYFGSVSLTMSPLRETVLEILKRSKDKNSRIYYDPNYRALLWSSEEEAKEWMIKGLNFADVVKVSEEEANLITGEVEIDKVLKKIHNYGAKGIFLTKGDGGVCVSYENDYVEMSALKIENVVDTTGAGDAFFGAAIGVLTQVDKDLDKEALIEAAKIGIIAAGLSVKGYGAVPSYPKLNDIEQLHS